MGIVLLRLWPAAWKGAALKAAVGQMLCMVVGVSHLPAGPWMVQSRGDGRIQAGCKEMAQPWHTNLTTAPPFHRLHPQTMLFPPSSI